MNIVKHVAIVGGGSSAWLTAAYLSKQCPLIKFTVIDKEIGNPIGVGEGTLLSFQYFMKDCGFELLEWFNAVDATYKTGALFPDWLEKGHEIWHPFLMSPTLENDVPLQSAWSNHQEYDFKRFGLALYDTAVVNNKIDSSVLESYAFHLDAGKLVQFFQNKLKDRIDFIASEVVKINKTGEKIDSLVLADGQNIEADLYIDCTGFRSVLRKQDKRVELMGRVFCDTAVCAQVSYIDANSEMRPYTRAQAVDHGWIWTIPTQSRMGSGMIFNRNITDVEEAKEYLVKYWDNRITKESIRVIDWTPYYLENPWVENVVSVGMAAGFIEPLESTGLALVQYQANSLMNVIKNNVWQKENVEIYNLEFKIRFEDCVDFVSSHYSKTNRTEKFWQFVNDTYKHTENISIILKLLEEDGPRNGSQRQFNHIFSGTNWTTWMKQLGYPIGNDKLVEKDYAKYLLMKHFNTVEKYRPNWSQHHATELLRAREYDRYSNI